MGGHLLGENLLVGYHTFIITFNFMQSDIKTFSKAIQEDLKYGMLKRAFDLQPQKLCIDEK